MAEDISYRISLALGNSRYDVPSDYLQERLVCELASMFTKNGSCLSSFNLTSRTIPNDDECFNRLVAEEFRSMSMSVPSVPFRGARCLLFCVSGHLLFFRTRLQ